MLDVQLADVEPDRGVAGLQPDPRLAQEDPGVVAEEPLALLVDPRQAAQRHVETIVGPGPDAASSVTLGVGRRTTTASNAPKPKTSSRARGGFRTHCAPPRSAPLTSRIGGIGGGGGSA